MPIYSISVAIVRKSGGSTSTTTRNVEADNQSNAMKLAKNIVELANPNAAKVSVVAAKLVKK
jgi:hypothetical protein